MKKQADKQEPIPANIEPQAAKLFMNGRSQAVRLPKEFRFEGDEVYIHREGERVILTAKHSDWKSFFEDEPKPSSDFMAQRTDDFAQTREIF